MSGEFTIPTNESGLSVYGLLKNNTTQFWNGSEFEDFAAGDFSTYVRTITEKGTSGIYVGDFPSAITTAGIYEMFLYVSTGTPGQGDRWLGSASYGTDASGSGTVISSSDLDLISLAELKEYLKVTTTNENAILQTLIHDVSAWVQQFIHGNLVAQDYVEYYSGDDSDELVLLNKPIVSVASVYVDALREWGATSLIDSSDYIIKKKSGIIQAFNLLGNFPYGESNIKVSYNAGYTVGSTSSGGTMPHDIRLAVKRIIDRQWRHGYTQRKLDVSSESISGMNVVFNTDAIPKDAREILEPYRQLIPPPQFSYVN